MPHLTKLMLDIGNESFWNVLNCPSYVIYSYDGSHHHTTNITCASLAPRCSSFDYDMSYTQIVAGMTLVVVVTMMLALSYMLMMRSLMKRSRSSQWLPPNRYHHQQQQQHHVTMSRWTWCLVPISSYSILAMQVYHCHSYNDWWVVSYNTTHMATISDCVTSRPHVHCYQTAVVIAKQYNT